MVKALLWKEWRRLRALRWSLVGIGLALPVLFAMAAKVAQRGWAFQAFTGPLWKKGTSPQCPTAGSRSPCGSAGSSGRTNSP